MYQKRTIKHMYPNTQKLALLCNDIEKGLNRMKKMVKIMTELEFNLGADTTEIKHLRERLNGWKEESMLSKITEELF